MNIGKLAEMTGVTTDTLRFYEKEGLMDAPVRGANGYRIYGDNDVARVRFVRSAQALGFSLQQIRWIVPRLAAGQVDRAEIEKHLLAKIAEIDAHIAQMQALKGELLATFDSLRCEPGRSVTVEHATSKKARTAPARTPRKGLRAAA